MSLQPVPGGLAVQDAADRATERSAAGREDGLARGPGSGAVRWRIYGLAWRELLRAGGARLRRLAGVWRLGARRPTRLVVASQDLRTSDPAVAQDVYSGIFILAGRAVHSGGRSPFAVPPPDAAWRDGLDGFGWLRHLRAADTPLARENARALVLEFLDRRGRRREPAPARVVSRRLLSFLHHSPLLLTGADHHFYSHYMRVIAADARALERAMSSAPRPVDRLWAAIGLSAAGLCCGGLEAKLRRGARALAAELDVQILPDGGHVGRNPALLVELLLDLLPLRQLFASRNLAPPAALDRAIERAAPMLKLLRHGDGELALFNGAGRVALDSMATLFSYDLARGEPVRHATHSGYARIEAGGTVAVADLGRTPPTGASEEAHAGCLSFELSSGPERIVVNCGAPLRAGPAREAARLTAAHSTVTLAGRSSARFLDPGPGAAPRGVAGWLARRLGRVALRGVGAVAAERREGEDGAPSMSGRHDGYARDLGLVHERRLHLAADGSRLEGRDAFHQADGRPAEPREAVARFHLHPGIRARLGGDPGSVELTLPSGAAWRFTLEGETPAGVAPTLETSIFFADADERRATLQIVAAFEARDGSSLGWRFEKVAGPPAADRSATRGEEG